MQDQPFMQHKEEPRIDYLLISMLILYWLFVFLKILQ